MIKIIIKISVLLILTASTTLVFAENAGSGVRTHAGAGQGQDIPPRV